jgi:choline dehydrogenase-like flavoprotein
MTIKLKKTDVVIVGLGAAGGYAALALARAGVDMVGLEAGPRWRPSDFPMDEIRNDVRGYMTQRPRRFRPGGSTTRSRLLRATASASS